MTIRETIASFIICLLSLTSAYADSTISIRPKRGFLILENFQHSTGMTYQYTGHDSDNSGSDSTVNRFEEFYRIQTSAAIVDRHLLNFQLDGQFWLQQIESSNDTNGSSSSNGSKYQYSLSASAFDQKWHPITFHSSRTESTVANPFTPSYDFSSTNNGILVSLLKGPVPTRVRYERNTTETSNSTYDYKTKSDAFFLDGTHHYLDISASSLGSSFTKAVSTSQGVEQTTKAYSLSFGNNLFWGRQKQYSLITQFDLQDTDTGSVPQQNVTLTETLLGHLGKALDADLVYRYLGNKTTTLTGDDQTFATNSLSASVTHHLYESLDTRLRSTVSRSDLPGGTQDFYSGSGALNYKKKLPDYKYLTLALAGEHAVTDRSGNISNITIRDEPHTVILPGEIITLGVSGRQQVASVTVTGYTVPPPTPQFPTDITFIENIDYTVDYVLGRIIWGPVVPAVPTIRVTYEYVVDLSLKYATDTVSLAGNLSIMSGKYILSGSIYNQNETLLEGEPQNGLLDTTILRLRFEGRTPESTYGLEFEDYSSGATNYQYLEGWWLYTRTTPLWAYTLQARDRYTSYDAYGASNGYWQNTISTAASCSRNLNSWSQMALSAIFIDTRREGSDGADALSLKANYRLWFNKITVNFLGQTSWRTYGNATTRDDYIRFELTRYF